ncbi:MAG: ABC transporter substrate-binding protein [Candidatus Velthaea sp.]
MNGFYASLFRRVAASTAIAIAVGFCAAPAPAAEPIKIGWLSSLTGPLSSAAQAENKGVQFAVAEINKSGGINGRQLELLTRDTAGDPTTAVNFVNQLLFNDKVEFIIGPVNSGESLATIPVVAKAGVPNLVIGSIDALIDPQKYPNAFRLINTNSQWILSANHYALDVLKRRKVALIGDTSGYGTSSMDTATQLLAKAGVKPVYTVTIDPNKADLTEEVGKARAAGADVIMPWSASTGLLARLLNARGDAGWNVPIVGHPALMALPVQALLHKPDYWKNAYAAGYTSTTYDKRGNFPARTKKLMDDIRPSLGGKIDFTFWWVALGYDCVKTIEYAVKKAGSTEPAAIAKALESTKNLRGVYGVYSWSPTEHNGFPDNEMMVNEAGTFKEGSFAAAPR